MFYDFETRQKDNSAKPFFNLSDAVRLAESQPSGDLTPFCRADRRPRRFSFARFPQEDKAVSIPKRIGVPAFPVNSHRDETPTPVELSTDKWITTKASETSRRASCKRDCISDKSETDSLSFLCNNFFKEKLF